MKLVQKVRIALIGAVMLVTEAVVGQSAYPTKPIRVLVGAPAGSLTDVSARIFNEHLREALGQPLIIENKIGAGSLVAVQAGATAAPDGYTLLFAANSAASIQAMTKNPVVDIRRDFVPVCLLFRGALGLYVNPSFPARSVADLIKHAKANPGKLNVGIPGIGTANHFTVEDFKAQAGVDIVNVPYNGGAALVKALAANEIQVLFFDIGFMRGFVSQGQVRLLGLAAPQESPVVAPGVPTIAASGNIPPVLGTFFYGYFAPAGLPREILLKLHTAMTDALKSASIQERLAALGYEPIFVSPEEAKQMVAAEVERFTKAVAAAKIELQ